MRLKLYDAFTMSWISGMILITRQQPANENLQPRFLGRSSREGFATFAWTTGRTAWGFPIQEYKKPQRLLIAKKKCVAKHVYDFVFDKNLWLVLRQSSNFHLPCCHQSVRNKSRLHLKSHQPSEGSTHKTQTTIFQHTLQRAYPWDRQSGERHLYDCSCSLNFIHKYELATTIIASWSTCSTTIQQNCLHISADSELDSSYWLDPMLDWHGMHTSSIALIRSHRPKTSVKLSPYTSLSHRANVPSPRLQRGSVPRGKSIDPTQLTWRHNSAASRGCKRNSWGSLGQSAKVQVDFHGFSLEVSLGSTSKYQHLSSQGEKKGFHLRNETTSLPGDRPTKIKLSQRSHLFWRT